MLRKIMILSSVIVVCAILVGLIAIGRFADRLLPAHQQAITKEIAAWGDTYSTINGPDDAAKSRKMVEYIRNYYVVSEGYSSDPQTDAALENQRRETIERINMALQKYKESSESSD